MSLNSLGLVVVGGAAASGSRLGLISADCSGAATREEATYIIFVLLSRLCTWG